MTKKEKKKTKGKRNTTKASREKNTGRQTRRNTKHDKDTSRHPKRHLILPGPSKHQHGTKLPIITHSSTANSTVRSKFAHSFRADSNCRNNWTKNLHQQHRSNAREAIVCIGVRENDEAPRARENQYSEQTFKTEYWSTFRRKHFVLLIWKWKPNFHRQLSAGKFHFYYRYDTTSKYGSYLNILGD